MFSNKQVPAVGVSLGIERVFAIMEQQEKDKNEVFLKPHVITSLLQHPAELMLLDCR
jgi:histidyl-tRNA synthetase